jgi:hypothetical protein
MRINLQPHNHLILVRHQRHQLRLPRVITIIIIIPFICLLLVFPLRQGMHALRLWLWRLLVAIQHLGDLFLYIGVGSCLGIGLSLEVGVVFLQIPLDYGVQVCWDKSGKFSIPMLRELNM